ncbi:MAG TPA: PQQ-binding-like beta-propeller repeat protein [Vicinamibacterales bacterium]|jgi:outer membrane protein assembly factor BamB|nr:PQQ-binding-like beta-propeller repeat protein [Vicinamibacterales bacterium]
MKSALTVVAALVVSVVAIGAAADWPQWQGPDRTGISKETGLLKQWPAPGPPQVWTAGDLGRGYGSMAVAGDRVYVQGMKGGNSIVSALNRADGKMAWSKPLGSASDNDQGPGPRGTPTVDGDRLYILTENGDLHCLKTDGSAVWHRNILADFRGRQLRWLISESPLVDGDAVIVSPGGNGAGMVKLDKMTGKTLWTSKDLSDPAGYSSPIVADVQGVRTYMTLTSNAGVGVRASDGKLMWHYERAANGIANITTPIFFDNKVFYTSAYDTGGGLVGLTAQNGAVTAKEIYFTRNMKNHHGGVVLVNGYLYGFNDSILTCLEFATGNPVWRDRSVGKGSVTFADGNLYIQGENNVVGLAEASPSGYKEKGRFSIPDKGLPSWAHPVVSGGRLYVRNQDTMMVYDIKAK